MHTVQKLRTHVAEFLQMDFQWEQRSSITMVPKIFHGNCEIYSKGESMVQQGSQQKTSGKNGLQISNFKVQKRDYGVVVG